MTKPTQIIMIDNYDSFTYNLVNQFRQLDLEVVIFRNDTPIDRIFTAQRLSENNCVIVISPGPGNPSTAGNSLKIIEKFSGQLPILGICLGHQSIVQYFGGKIDGATEIVHGKADRIETTDHPVFESLTQTFQAARYHSLVAAEVPDCLEVIACCNNEITKEVMAVVHKKQKVLGFQFHPESILTTHGRNLLKESIRWLLSSKGNHKNSKRTKAKSNVKAKIKATAA
ncbi:MAG: aminodeoxychorismate/anthranilate synthase component II [Kangiellaceae bacterium]|nr:aminodeoxychorismate/anthranilate synthase component II [Kangiellaceae bacterium]